MRKISEQKVRRADAALLWSSRIKGLTRILAGVFLSGLSGNPVQALTTNGPGQSVTLGWNRSPDVNIAGYRVYDGVVSHTYTNVIDAGNATNATVSGLIRGTTYFFAATAYNSLGLESVFSTEISFTVPMTLPGVQLRVTTAKQIILTVKGQNSHTYDIQATTNFAAWTVIGTVTMGTNGSLDFTDTNASGFSRRFYRTRE